MKKTVQKDLSQIKGEGVYIGINTSKSPVFLNYSEIKNTNNLILAKAGQGMSFNCKIEALKEIGSLNK